MLLPSILPHVPEGVTQIVYETESTSSRVNPVEADRKVAELAKRLHESKAAEAERMIEKYRQSLEAPTTVRNQAELIFSKDFSADHRGGERDGVWEIRKGDCKYRVHDTSGIVIFYDPERRTRDTNDLAMDTIGTFGTLPPAVATELMQGCEIKVEGAVAVLRKGSLTVKGSLLEGGGMRLQSIEYYIKEVDQRRTTLFEDYGEVNGMIVPRKVRHLMVTAGDGSASIYTVKKITRGGEFSVPLINAEFGLRRIFDNRFSPKVEYMASSTLPTDEQVAEWASDPAALKRHNDAMQRLMDLRK